MNPHSEIWAPIPGTRGKYAASTHGRIRSLDHIINRSDGMRRRFYGQIMNPTRHARRPNQLYVSISKGRGNQQAIAVHRLVLAAFDPNFPARKQVRHIDGNPHNNTLRNLTYNGQLPIPYPRERVMKCPQGHKMRYPHIIIDLTTGRAICRACHRTDKKNPQWTR